MDQNRRVTVTGRVKDSAQRDKVMQTVRSLGISEPVTYQVAILKEKKPKKTKRRSSSEEEGAPAPRPEEPVRPLLPRFD